MAVIIKKKKITAEFLASTKEKPKWFPGSLIALPREILAKPKKPHVTPNVGFYDIHVHGLTQSTIATYLQCPRKAELKMKHGIQAGNFNHALDFGSVFHEVLDKVYTQKIGLEPGKKIGKPLSFWEEVLGDYKEKQLEKLDIADEEKFELMYTLSALVLNKYLKWWDKEDQKAKIIEVEKEFGFPYMLRNGITIPIRGKIDRIDQLPNGDIWLFETKSKSEIEALGKYSHEAILEKMAYELQVQTYAIAIKHMYGKYPKGVIYNLVKRPGQIYKGTFNRKPESVLQFIDRVEADMDAKSNRTTNSNEYFLRYHIRLDPKEIEEYKLTDFDWVVEQLYDFATMNRRGFRNSKNCSMYRRPCEYLPICSGERSIDSYEQRKEVFPELSEIEIHE